MKQTLYYLFLALAGLFVAPWSGRAQICTTSAGTLGSTAPQMVCQGTGFAVTSAGDAVLDGDDVLRFVVATSPGLPLGTVLATSTTGQFAYDPVFLPGTTYYIFAVAGNDDGSGGLDWADPCLAASPAVTLTLQPAPVANAGPDVVINCVSPAVTLNGTGSSTGANFAYQWTGPHIVSSTIVLNPTVDEAGTYCLVVIDLTTGCTATDCVTVLQDANLPVAQITPPPVLSCVIIQVQLNGFASSVGPNFTYSWGSTGGGNIVSGQNTLTPTIIEPGIYCLTVTNTTNGCSSVACVTVEQDIVIPVVNAGPDFILTCTTPEAQLNGSNSSTGPNFAYSWTGPGIAWGSNTLNPSVNTGGTYCLTVTNVVNGCTGTDCVNVALDIISPTSLVATGDTFSCADPVATLSATVFPPNAALQWTGPAGFTAAGPTIQVSIEATYTVVATDPNNGCTATATATALGDSTLPRVDATVVPMVCGSSGGSITLTPNPPGQQLEYLWSNGVVGPQALDLAAGDYLVTITDTQGGCSKTVAFHIESQTLEFTVSQTPVSCFGASDGGLSVTPLNGSGPYTFLWTGPNGFTSTQQNLTGLIAGSYKVVITDVLGCSVDSGWIGVTQPTLLILTGVQVLPACDNDGAIFPTVNGGTPPYSYHWSNTVDTQNNTGLSPGTYTLTVTDANGCTVQQLFTVLAVSPFQVVSQVNSTCTNETVVLTVTPANANYTYQWSNGYTTPVITTGGMPGTYIVTITSGTTGCSQVLTFALSGGGPGSDCGLIRGRIVRDENNDCMAGTAESGLAQWIVRAIGQDTLYSVSDQDGYYELGALPGTYSLQAIVPSAVWQNCAPISIDALADDTVDVNLPVQPLALCPALTVDVATAQLRRCFNNNYYSVSYCNEGTSAATDAYVVLTLDPFISFENSAQSHISLGNNQYQFYLGTVAPGDCGYFWVQVYVSCNAQLGQTHCTEAAIYPDSLCLPGDPNWTGASIQVEAWCDGDSVRFNIKNAGNGPMTTDLDYIVIEDGIMLMQTSGPGLGAGDSVVVAVPANGSTWRLEANQEALHPGPSMPSAVVEGCTVTGSFSTGFVNQFPADDAGPTLDIDCTANTGSYDPNDKQGFPIGYGADHYVRPGTELEYLIRFQNTGTDTAFTVVVRDTLSAWLDAASVQPGASSHPYTFELSGEGILAFHFDNILLPDSFVNEAASHGFVRFRIAPRSAVPLETDILNRAAIYFDFNDPVLTNTVQHRVGENFIVSGIFTPEQPNTTVRIAPNPWATETTVWLEEWPLNEPLTLSIFSSTGRLVRQEPGNGPACTLRAGGLPAGLYWLRVESAGRLGFAKFIVR